MQPSVETPTPQKTGWNYVSLTVRDHGRLLKPSQVAYDQIIFPDPPRLTSSQVEIFVINGDAQDRYLADILPHDPAATCIPIRLLSAE